MTQPYDDALTKDIVSKSLKKVGCIPPFLPLNKTEGLRVCTNDSDGQIAYQIYNDQV